MWIAAVIAFVPVIYVEARRQAVRTSAVTLFPVMIWAIIAQRNLPN